MHLPTLPPAVETAALRGLTRLPERVQRRLVAGPPVVVDGQTLAVDVQSMLALQRIAKLPVAELLPIPEGREVIARQSAVAGGRQPIGAVRDLPVGDLAARLYSPSRLPEGPSGLLVFFHGGGFMYGDLDSHDAPCRLLAERARVRVLAIDYRLAPEHPFPAAFEDCLAAYRWVVANAESLGADPSRLAVGGDSAGGNLSAAVALDAAREGLPLAFQLLLYPKTDNTMRTRSMELFEKGFFLTGEFMELATASYLPSEEDRPDPRVSPLLADVPDGLAPAYLATAGFDPLRDEGEAYARRLAEAGVPVELKRFPDQIHGFLNMLVLPSARACVGEAAAKLGAALA